MYQLYYLIVISLLIIGMIFLINKFSVYYFRQKLKRAPFLPIVNMRGDVIGKALLSSALCEQSEQLYPIIRIAITVGGRLFLVPRPKRSCYDKGKMDLPIEGHLIFGETIDEGVNRILSQALPDASRDKLYFHLMHHFQNKSVNRLVYLFTWELEESDLQAPPEWEKGKQWTLRQIEHNIGKEYFCSCLEEEFIGLKEIIYTRERYKESC